MIRVVVDTNVFISAALKENSTPGRVIRFVQQRGIFLKSDVTEAEFFRILAKPKLVKLLDDRPFISDLIEIFKKAELVPITNRLEGCRDPNDDKFLELAVNARASMIVSGDADLLTLHPFQGIPIVDPATFCLAFAT